MGWVVLLSLGKSSTGITNDSLLQEKRTRERRKNGENGTGERIR
jgi:hypothetical protein